MEIKRIKKLWIILITLILPLFLDARIADAHVLITDKNIGAILHIEPDDDPIAGGQSSFFFEFKDTQNKFDPQKCDCTFTILENGNQIYAQPLFQNNRNPNLASASVFYTFPKKDVYQIQVIGRPYTPSDFQPFTLVYNVRVARTANQSSVQNSGFFAAHMIQFLIGGIFLLVFAMLIVANYVKGSSNKRIKNEK